MNSRYLKLGVAAVTVGVAAYLAAQQLEASRARKAVRKVTKQFNIKTK